VVTVILAGVTAAIGVILLVRAFGPSSGTVPGGSYSNGKLAVVREACAGDAFACGGGHLVLMNADGTDAREIAVGSMPAWSPDGSRLAFTTGGADAIQVVDDDGASLTTIVRCEEPECLSVREPTWSPDGSQLAYVVERHVGGEGEVDIWVVNADGTGAHPVTACRYPDCSGNFAPAWSPVDDRIAMWSMVRCGDRWGPSLRLLDLTTGGIRQVVRCGKWSTGSRIGWSPDGRTLVFELSTPDQTSNIFTESAEGGPRTQVTFCDRTDCRWADYPSWAPDGHWLLLAVKAASEETFAVARVRPDGTEFTRLGIKGFMPVWQPVRRE